MSHRIVTSYLITEKAIEFLGTVSDPRFFLFLITSMELAGTSMFALPRERTLMMSCFEERACLVRLKDFEKYIYHYENLADELFDLSTDPEEQANLAGGRGEELSSWREELFEWRDGINGMYRSWRATH